MSEESKCQDCGELTNNYSVPVKIFYDVFDQEIVIVCKDCFEARCNQKGLYLKWSCQVLDALEPSDEVVSLYMALLGGGV